MQTIAEKPWHHLLPDEAVTLLETHPDRGLDSEEVVRRQHRFGANALTQKKGKGPLTIFFLQFHQPLIYILLAASLVTALLREWVDSGVILAVVLVNAVIGFVQESKALQAIQALARTLESEATVIRAGETQHISAAGLVPGDLVLLRSGDKVPADLRVLRCRELQIDESALTGESVPVAKQPDPLDLDTVLADRNAMLYSSTLVTYGTGTGVVVATGDTTEIGTINTLIASVDVLATPLTTKMAQFSAMLLWVILGMAGLTVAVGVLHGESWFNMFMAAVALAVGAIPEGLPAVVTITLAIGVTRMAARHTIIRKLPAVETLGSTTVICSDKTGTLTQNQMTVQEIVTDAHLFTVSGVGYAPIGQFSQNGQRVDPDSDAALIECLTAGLLCNDSRIVRDDDGWHVEGDPTEGAINTAANKAGLFAEHLQARLPRIDSIPFESQHQYMVTLHEVGPDQPRRLYIKGSVESLLPRCHDVFAGHLAPTDIDREYIHARTEDMAARGLRVLAFARATVPAETASVTHEHVATGLTFLGLQGMIDPPRPEAVQAIRTCHSAGINVKMITGDHLGTASAIATTIGLAGSDHGDPTLSAVNGRALADLSEAAFIETADRTAVFARVTPEQKLRLVQALQTEGHVVAMTGDGVNDAPALRQADIGVAMGITGTEVSKEASDMVLTDDNFSSIQAAVEEGRGVFDNLVKFITWTLPTNIGEGLVILVAVFAGVALPILPVQILWINMTTAVLLGLMLAFEPKEPGIMTRPPREPGEPILTRPLIRRIILVGLMLLAGAFGLFKWTLLQSGDEAIARTVAVNVFVFGELFYLFNCRSLTYSMFALGIFSNRWIWLGVSGMVALQFLFTYHPVMHRIFDSASLDWHAWALIIGWSTIIYAVVDIEKRIQRRGSRRH